MCLLCKYNSILYSIHISMYVCMCISSYPVYIMSNQWLSKTAHVTAASMDVAVNEARLAADAEMLFPLSHSLWHHSNTSRCYNLVSMNHQWQPKTYLAHQRIPTHKWFWIVTSRERQSDDNKSISICSTHKFKKKHYLPIIC